MILSFYCAFLLSSPKESFLHCERSSDTERLISLSYNEKIFYMENTERGCSSEYSYKENRGEGGWIITSFSGFDDLGINAYNIVYLVSPGANDAIYAGEVPGSAVELEDGTFENIVQSGGSIYKSVYKLDNGKFRYFISS